MWQIQLTRKAVKNLQTLQSTGASKVPERLFAQLAKTDQGEKFLHTIHLSGYPHLWRSRLDLGGGSSLRLIWTENLEDDSIRFLYVDQRDDDTYEFDLNELPQEPAYYWNGETGVEWTLFLNGAYNGSPVLTPQQRAVSAQVGQRYAYEQVKKHIGFFARITQSPPGTGKTITAALRACELYEANWNIIFLLPQHLLEDVKEFHCIRSIPSDLSEGFFYGTFQDWIIQLCPDIANSVISPEDELQILKKLAIRAEKINKKLSFGEIERRDVILFQSFVLGSGSSHTKNVVYKENEQRIQDLRNIQCKWWNEEFERIKKISHAEDKLSRSEIADALCDRWNQGSNLPNQNRGRTILIIDEAQDYLLDEIKAIKILCKQWHQSGHPTHLWLLGDLNQRIMPVDFTWGDLELVQAEEPDWQCFRNSSRILRFSNLFLSPVSKISHGYKTRASYQPTAPEKAYEIGENVKLLTYPSESEAEDFLEKLSQALGATAIGIEKERSLIHKLASRVKIFRSEAYQSKYSDRLDFLNVHEAKGREFDTCVVFNIFKYSEANPISEDWWQWYTLLTRTRSRLLVIIADEQLQLLKNHIPSILSECERIDGKCSESIEFLAQWVQAESNDLEFSSREKEIVKQYLIDALQFEKPLIYWDMYEVLDRIGIIGEDRTALENQLLKLLRKCSQDLLVEELELSKVEATNPLIHCLILRAMKHSWDAVHTVKPLKATHFPEYQRVIEAIAQDLETSNLLVEAARVRFQMLDIPYPIDLPMSEIAQVEGDLLTALVQILQSRMQKY